MNCFSGLSIPSHSMHSCTGHVGSRYLVLLLLVWSIACNAAEHDAAVTTDDRKYGIVYSIRPDPHQGTVEVELELRQSRSLLRELTMPNDSRLFDIKADGDLETSDSEIRWGPPAGGGTLRWRVNIKHQRDGNGFDAWLGPDWALFRAEDAIPRAATRTVRGANSDTRLSFDLPSGWSVVTQYMGTKSLIAVDNPERRFDQPSGWIVMGKIGVRRESIAGTRVTVAGPIGHSIRRMEVLALLNWTLPELARLLPELADRLTIISAGEPMWRGGLSGPQSLYLHADRPLISENATSPLLHELMHLALGIKSQPGYDWIVEGLAEYYSIEILRRSGTITESRYRAAITRQAEWAKSSSRLCQQMASGATTALAVTIFAKLDAEMRDHKASNLSLDDLARALWSVDEPIGLQHLQDAARQMTGHDPKSLNIDNLAGCSTIDARS